MQEKESELKSLRDQIAALQKSCEQKETEIRQLKEQGGSSQEKEALLQNIETSNSLIAELNETISKLKNDLECQKS